ncbi:hypothetical protein QR680_001901 [Steinernema hermaphroditum]|uniref:EGF-like domain-containing protein n=1 Tax=Steinernema hermaphroditum TaxID=289476 RepID=A0AA39H190_9BILA|nr:hypothetical protein QR680_001901 [Steinernema hermaphroditum]
MARSRTKFELIWLLSTVVLSTVASENHLPSLLSGVQARNLWQLFVDRRVALQFDILQDDNTEGTLISVFQGRTSSRLLFSLTTSTVNNKILLRFRSASDSLKTYTLSAPLNDGQWHKIIVSLQGNRIDLSENCHQLLSKEDDELHFRSVHHPRVYVGQQAHHHNKFQGKMREFSADSSNPVPIRCPNLDLMLDNFVSTKTETPHEGEQEQAVDSAPDQPTSSATENINWNEHVSFMEDQIKQVKLMLQGVDNRLKKVELHQRGCQIAGKIISFGEKQQDPLNCTECQCSSTGELFCNPIALENAVRNVTISVFTTVNTTNMAMNFGQNNAFDVSVPTGEWIASLEERNTVQSFHVQNKRLPPISVVLFVRTSTTAQRTTPATAMPSAKTTLMAPSASAKRYVSFIRPAFRFPFWGFFGNGTLCYDVDECIWDENAKEQLGGCQLGTMCINLPGAFKCDCLPGYQRLDDRNCLDVIRI